MSFARIAAVVDVATGRTPRTVPPQPGPGPGPEPGAGCSAGSSSSGSAGSHELPATARPFT